MKRAILLEPAGRCNYIGDCLSDCHTMKKSPAAIIKAKQKASQLLQARRLDEAWEAYEHLSRHTPADHEVWLNLGAIAAMRGRLGDAEMAFRKALALNPALPQAQINMGQLLMLQQRPQEALPYFQNYVKLQPKVLAGYLQLGRLLESLGNGAAAEQVLRDALQLEERSADLHTTLGRLLHARGEHEAAREQCEIALQLNPNTVLAWLELGNIHREQNRFEAALHCYQQMIALAPHERENYLLLLALLHAAWGRHDEALECYRQVLELNPDSISGHWNRALLLLQLGRFSEGWDEYEWRWQREMLKREHWQGFSQPLWAGEPLAGKTVLIYAEQGLGDTIQFGRYLPLLLAQGAQVIFHCQPELLKLFQHMKGLEVIPKSYELARQQNFDYYLPLMSLPRIMGTTLEAIPATIPYLQSDSEKVKQWRSRITQGGLKVGLVWAGSTTNPFNAIRSASLPLFESVATIPGVQLYSLQKGTDAKELEQFEQRWGLIDLAPELHDFDDTAAAIENLDLIISVDTAVAHLAGALGKPVWTLIYFPSEWRWLLGRDDSPWYPAMRLFRQSAADGGWLPVIERVARALRERLQTPPLLQGESMHTSL